jgi:glycerol-3-phosphate acyltransferase PlsY
MRARVLGAGLAGVATGSVPVGLIVSALVGGIDIRRYGTGNIGASNVRRHVGLVPAAVVGVASFGQGYLPARLVRLGGGAPAEVAAAATGSVCGYAWSPLLRFRGGSAVGTATGALTAIDARVLVPLLVPYTAGALVRRPARGVLAGMLAASAWLLVTPRPRAGRVAGLLIAAAVITKRFEGVGRDLKRDDAGRVVAARLLDDRRPGRPLQGLAA